MNRGVFLVNCKTNGRILPITVEAVSYDKSPVPLAEFDQAIIDGCEVTRIRNFAYLEISGTLKKGKTAQSQKI